MERDKIEPNRNDEGEKGSEQSPMWDEVFDGKPELPSKPSPESTARRLRIQHIQDTLAALQPIYMLDDLGNSRLSDSPTLKKLFEQERQERRFGEATKLALKNYSAFLEKAVPQTIKELSALQLPIPAGCPVELPLDSNGRRISPELHNALSSSGALRLQLNLETAEIPTEKALDKLDNIYNWLARCNQTVATARQEQQVKSLAKLIEDNALPSKWHLKPGEDVHSWRASAEEMIDLSVRTRNYVEAMQSLYKAARKDNFPLELPPGTRLVVQDKAGKQHKIDDSTIDDLSNRALLKQAVIKEVQLDLPEDLRQQAPTNESKIDRLRKWLETHGEKIDQAVAEIVQVQKNPDSILMYGDQEIKNGKALLNESGEFIRLVSATYKPGKGHTVEDINLVGYDFSVERISDGPLSGKYKITQTIQAEKAPWYAYQNIRALGVEQVGKPMPVEEQLTQEEASKRYGCNVKDLQQLVASGQLKATLTADGEQRLICPKVLDGDDFVPVKDGDQIQIIKAKDLQSFKSTRKTWYAGEKLVTATMDCAMLVSGTIELGAAIKGARLAAGATESALKLTAGEATREVGKATTRIVVGSTGLLNNAGARESALGERVNTARGLYFLGDIGLGLAKNGVQALRPASVTELSGKASEATSAEKLHRIISGGVHDGVQVRGIPWIAKPYEATSWTFKVSEAGSAPLIGKELRHELSILTGEDNRRATTDAVVQRGTGRDKQERFQKPIENATARLATADNLLSSYEASLAARKNNSSMPATEILRQAREVLRTARNTDEVDSFKSALLKNIVFSSEEIAKLESLHPASTSEDTAATFHFTSQQLKELLDPEKRRSYPVEVRREAEAILSRRDKEAASVSLIALLILSSKPDGGIPDTVAFAQSSIPEQHRLVNVEQETGNISKEVVTASASVEQTITASDVVKLLKIDLSNPTQAELKIIAGDVLTRMGALSHQQYGAVLQDILTDPSAAPALKLTTLHQRGSIRFPEIIHGLMITPSERSQTPNRSNQDVAKTPGRTKAEQGSAEANLLARHVELGRNHGLTAESLLQTLKQVIGSDTDRSVRSTAALSWFALQQSDQTKRTAALDRVAVIVETTNIEQREHAVDRFLLSQALLPIPGDSSGDKIRDIRVHAAEALAALHEKDSATESSMQIQRTISRTLASSISPTDIGLTAKILKALDKERLEELEKSSAGELNNLRQAVIGLIRKPANAEEESQLISLIERLPTLFQSADVELKRQVVNRTHDMLHSNALNLNYAREFPRLRGAAINLLVDAEFLTQNSLNVIRSHTGDTGSFIIQGNEVRLHEPDASVRRAAIAALEKLRDPYLKKIVAELLDRESDVSAATKLRDVHFFEQRIARSSREYKELYERTRVELVQFGDKYPYLAEFGQQAQLEWINSRFPLLNKQVYVEKASDAVRNATDWVDRRFNLNVSIMSAEWSAGNRIHEQRNAQWDELVGLARKGGPEGNKAKLALHYIMTHNGEPLGAASGLDAGAVKGFHDSDHLHRYYEGDWKFLAARELAAMAKEYPEGKDIVVQCIRRGLTLNEQLPGYVSEKLLEGWQALGNPDGKSFSISRQELATVTADALRAELNRPKANQSATYQSTLLSDLARYKHRLAVPVLEALRDGSSVPELRELTGQLLASLQDSVETIWQEVAEDKQSTQLQRAIKLKQALLDKADAETTVEQMFSAYKGYAIKDGTDPGLNQLHVALRDSSEKVRLAACKIVMNGDLPVEHHTQSLAIMTLTRLSVESSTETGRKEAYAMLSGLKLEKPLVVGAPDGLIYKLERKESILQATLFKSGKLAGTYRADHQARLMPVK